MRERDIARLLAEREDGACEVRTPAGTIDVLTAKYVYEVKVAHQWKAALGQVLAYAHAYPDRKPRLYLYGDLRGMTKKAIEAHCRAVGVGVVWHRDEDIPPPAPRTPAAPPADALSLQLSALDARYGIRTTTTIRLPKPTAPIARETLDAYADEALRVFDALLDNELTVRLKATYGGERTVIERKRESITGEPVYYQLRMTLCTERYHTFTVSLAGVRKELLRYSGMPGSYIYTMNHAGRPLPELQALEALALHPVFPWVDVNDVPAIRVERITVKKYGMTRTRTGWKLAR